MKIETHHNLFFEGYTDQTEFQKEVIRIILSDDKFLIFYIGRCDDLDWHYKYYLFGARWKNGVVKIKSAEIKEKWEGLMLLTGKPTWCIVMWKRNKCKYIPKVSKPKKDGTPRKNPNWKKLENKKIEDGKL